MPLLDEPPPPPLPGLPLPTPPELPGPSPSIGPNPGNGFRAWTIISGGEPPWNVSLASDRPWAELRTEEDAIDAAASRNCRGIFIVRQTKAWNLQTRNYFLPLSGVLERFARRLTGVTGWF